MKIHVLLSSMYSVFCSEEKITHTQSIPLLKECVNAGVTFSTALFLKYPHDSHLRGFHTSDHRTISEICNELVPFWELLLSLFF